MNHPFVRCAAGFALFALLAAVVGETAFAQAFIVQDGVARAEIVIAQEPTRMQKLAAEELQEHLEKIAGATLPIVSEPTGTLPVRVYVGMSPGAQALGLSAEGLKNGAFRMKSGESWLGLVGVDTDFVPPEPYARSGAPDERARALAEWDALTGAKWNNPVGASMYRGYSRQMDIWEGDRHGSMNAVHEFLRGLGVRWYMPGELGTILPAMRDIELPRVDKVVEPDYALRLMYFARHFSSPREDIMWYIRLGLNRGGDVRRHYFTHGMRDVTRRVEMKESHPEHYALRGDRRHTYDERNCDQCLSSEGLFQENVAFVRAMFDIYDMPLVSVMPSDGYQMCGCHLCEDKIDLDRPRAGQISNYVWDYVNRVGKELYKTHPDKKISCSAYANFTLPPTNIDKLSPNIVVAFTHGRGKHILDPSVRAEKEELWRVWLEKSSNPLMIGEHYVFTHRGTFLPVYFPHAIDAGLKALKGKSLGETVEVAMGPGEVRGHGLHEPGFNHLNVYVTARLYWDADQDVDALLDEYYRSFYGPAAEEMKVFVEYSEANWPEMNKDAERVERVLELIGAAEKAAPADTPYGERIALVVNYLKPLHNLLDQLKHGRDDARVARLAYRRGAEQKVAIDGKLDEETWRDLFAYRLVDAKTGDRSAIETTFKAFWHGGRVDGNLYLGIRCEDPDMENLNIAATEKGDARVFEGDLVEIILETQAHSHYQIAVNPAGAMVDLDRKAGLGWDWSSQAEIATHIGNGFWSVEARIPVTGTDTAEDPLNEVVGRRPVTSFPWFFNICRQRVRGDERQTHAFSPTGDSTFHDRMKFGKIHCR